MRTMPIGNTKQKMLRKLAKGDKDGVFDVWANSAQWHSFLKKCKVSPIPERHEINLFYFSPDGWKGPGFYINFNWLKFEFEIFTIPEHEIPEGFAEARPFNSWELPGQRFLENFTDIISNTDREET